MIALVVAAAENNVIGKDNDLIWYLPADLKHFKSITMGHPMLMGRKTYESIGKPLPGRTSIIITSQKDFKAEGCVVVHSLEEALEKGRELDDDLCIIGGANVYQQALPLADKVYLTRVHHSFDGDVFFPELSPAEWQVVEEEHHEPDEKNKYSYTFQTLTRK
ncbi:dihydrofolate reductase [Pontibacter akesuensis]|uniref:Dihydrofolate reductase n=1 Tax=Pontibacter akesuensis TaxID=388950 RepID=A0A1I7GZ48_9BACT|nr:dihydrofolate reductase [Pontibacter akesuensis]GHA54337.1 dihydrofolate reductase [Pontibacter akesuensis]SFU53734.1 dihydrofolate reductase [Pontibacter akesuensis]